jgi:hypothetical protein
VVKEGDRPKKAMAITTTPTQVLVLLVGNFQVLLENNLYTA